MSTRTSSAEWKGSLKEGSGNMRVGNGAWEGPFSFASRFEVRCDVRERTGREQGDGAGNRIGRGRG